MYVLVLYSLGMLATMLFLVILSYVALTMPLWHIFRERIIPEMVVVTKSNATVQVILWSVMYMLLLYINERD